MTVLLNRASLIVLAAAALTACTTARSQYAPYEGYQTPPPATPMQPKYPASAADTPAPATAAASASKPASEEDAPEATPVEAVPSEALPPVNRRPGASSSNGAVDSAPLPTINTPPAASTPPAAPAYTPPPQPAYTPPPPQPAYSPPPRPARRVKPPEPTYIVSVKGRVVAAKSKTRTITVDKDDTVNSLSERFLATKAELLKLNKIKKPKDLNAGQSMKIPTPKAYVVESGDTLYSIGRRFNVSADVLAELNDLDTRGRLRSGEEVALPVGIRDSGPLKKAESPAAGSRVENEYPTAESSSEARAPTEPTPYRPMPPVRGETPSYSAPLPAYTPPQTPAPSDAEVAAAGRGKFVWPVHGDILSKFGLKPDGQRNDGVNIAAPTGTTVMAAAEGDVVYAGNQVPGFGNLVLVKHTGGWVTAYAYLSKTTVKIKDHLSQGDEVGEVGQTGGVDLPQLHFEIRYAPTTHDKAKPVDPALLLPGQ